MDDVCESLLHLANSRNLTSLEYQFDVPKIDHLEETSFIHAADPTKLQKVSPAKQDKSYERSIRAFKSWISVNHEKCYNSQQDSVIMDRLTEEIIMGFLVLKSAYENGRQKSISSLNTYKRAIESLYRSSQIEMPEQLRLKIASFQAPNSVQSKHEQLNSPSSTKIRMSSDDQSPDVEKFDLKSPIPSSITLASQLNSPPRQPPNTPMPNSPMPVSHIQGHVVSPPTSSSLFRAMRFKESKHDQLFPPLLIDTTEDNQETTTETIAETSPKPSSPFMKHSSSMALLLETSELALSAENISLNDSSDFGTDLGAATGTNQQNSSSNMAFATQLEHVSINKPSKQPKANKAQLSPSRKYIIQGFHDVYVNHVSNSGQSRGSEGVDQSGSNDSPTGTWFWGNKDRCVPPDFVFPHTDVKTLFYYWHHGNPSLRIVPYRNIRGSDLQHNDGTDLSKARVVMSALEHIAVTSELVATPQDIKELSGAETEALFDTLYTHLVDNFLIGKVHNISRNGEISYVTLYRHVKNYFTVGGAGGADQEPFKVKRVRET